MKKFLVFLGRNHYPAAGWVNCIGSVDTRLELLTLLENKVNGKEPRFENSEDYWLQLVEHSTDEISMFSFETEDFSLTPVQNLRVTELLTAGGLSGCEAAAKVLEDNATHGAWIEWEGQSPRITRPEDQTQSPTVSIDGKLTLKELRALVFLMAHEEQEFQSKQPPV